MRRRLALRKTVADTGPPGDKDIMRISTGLITVALILAAGQARPGENPLAGTWELVSVEAAAADGSVDSAAYGPAPHGYITYTVDDYMTVLFSFADRPHIRGSWRAAPEQDRAEAFATVLAYAGTYSLEADSVTHHVTVSTDPNRVGTSISRRFTVSDDVITLTAPAIDLDTSAKRYSLAWRRVMPRDPLAGSGEN